MWSFLTSEKFEMLKHWIKVNIFYLINMLSFENKKIRHNKIEVEGTKKLELILRKFIEIELKVIMCYDIQKKFFYYRKIVSFIKHAKL